MQRLVRILTGDSMGSYSAKISKLFALLCRTYSSCLIRLRLDAEIADTKPTESMGSLQGNDRIHYCFDTRQVHSQEYH